MLKSFISKILILILMLSFINGCGGDDESSDLISGISSGDKDSTTDDLDTGPSVHSLTLLASPLQQLANGIDEITLTLIARDNANIPLSDVEVSISSDSNTAIFDQGTATTSVGGTVTFMMTNTVEEILTITATANDKEATQTVAFVNTIVGNISLNLSVTDNEQLANGQDSIQIELIARNQDGSAAEALPIIVLFPFNALATSNPSAGSTDANGLFTTNITSNLPGDVVIKLAVENTSFEIQTTLTFIAQEGDSTTRLLVTVTNDKQIANGTDAIQVNVIARDAEGQAVTGIPLVVQISSDDILDAIIANPSEGDTNNNGVFTTEITSTSVGTATITIAVENTTLQSIAETVTFIAQPPGEGITDVAINLITNDPELGSVGDSEGVIITAFVVNTANNNPVTDILVNFSSCFEEDCNNTNIPGVHGEIQAIQVEGSGALPGITGVSGRAQARLTTQVNHDNRTLLITANALGDTDTINIDVRGTTLTLATDTQNMVFGDFAEISIFIKDSEGFGINRQTLSVSSRNQNPLCWVDNLDCTNPANYSTAPINIVSNTSGQAIVRLRADIAGNHNEDVITVTRELTGSNSLTLNISDDNFILTSSNIYPIPQNFTEVTDIVLVPNNQTFLVHWDKYSINQSGRTINIFSTRGDLNSTTITTDANGNATFTIQSNNSGPATIRANVDNGPSVQLSVEFVATIAHNLELQANPVTIGVNTPGSNTEQSEIIAVVRDPNNNLVKDKIIDFTLIDITGGRLSSGSGVTDSFGRTSTVYIAGTTSSAANGVEIYGEVVSTPTVNDRVFLTVAGRSLFVTLGTGNTMLADGPTRYKVPYTALVTDANGVALTETDIILSIEPLLYATGKYCIIDSLWEQFDTRTFVNEDTNASEDDNNNGIFDPWEDDNNNGIFDGVETNNNGILDEGEDTNNNGILEPGNVATFDAGGIVNTVETDANGFADFFIVYPKNFAGWVQIRLHATVIVEGTEGHDQVDFWLRRLAADYSDITISPPGEISPYGDGGIVCPPRSAEEE